MTKNVAAQKQYITKKIVSVYNIFHIFYSCTACDFLKSYVFRNPVFLLISIEVIACYFVFKCKFRY